MLTGKGKEFSTEEEVEALIIQIEKLGSKNTESSASNSATATYQKPKTSELNAILAIEPETYYGDHSQLTEAMNCL